MQQAIYVGETGRVLDQTELSQEINKKEKPGNLRIM
jgi:hypothetical protein